MNPNATRREDGGRSYEMTGRGRLGARCGTVAEARGRGRRRGRGKGAGQLARGKWITVTNNFDMARG